MTNIYETTIIVKPDLANDQLKNLNTSIDQFFYKFLEIPFFSYLTKVFEF